MATTSKQRLALAICDFLSTSLTDGTVQSEDKESVEVAINCIAETFSVDPNDKAAIQSALGTQNLLQIYAVYEKLKNSGQAAAGASNASTSTTTPSAKPAPPSEEVKKQAEALKSKGNAAMKQNDHAGAIDLYTQALALYPDNAVYLSNRAAAHSDAGDYTSARADAEAAVAVDPSYTKGWSRLGLAKWKLGDARGSMEAYKQGIEHEGNGGSEAMKRGYETAKRRVEDLEAKEGASDATRDVTGAGAGSGAGGPNLADLAGMFGGGRGSGGGGGGGGMPDLSSIMSNPMFASMAQNLMSNPDMMNSLMSNPRLREMASSFGSGGGMPDISALMSDPNIADMARSMMGGGGRGAGSGGAGSRNQS